MVDTIPSSPSPQDDEPQLENDRTPIADAATPQTAIMPDSAAPAAADPHQIDPHLTASQPGAPVPEAPGEKVRGIAPRSKRGLILAGGIVAAVIVLGGTFGGGVLVGTSITRSGGIHAQDGSAGARFPGTSGQRGFGNDDPGAPSSGTRSDGSARGGTRGGSGNDDTSTPGSPNG